MLTSLELHLHRHEVVVLNSERHIRFFRCRNSTDDDPRPAQLSQL